MKQTITYQNYQVNYYCEGSGELLIFLHGWPTNSRLWDAQVELFSKNYRVITIDWLGFGQSDEPKDYTFTFSKKKEILDILITELTKSNEKVNLIAHDIGGPPAILWASENEDRVKRLVLLNTILFPFSTPLDKMSHFFFKVPILKDIIVSSFGLKTLMNTLMRSSGNGLKERINTVLNWHQDFGNQTKLNAILEPLHEGKEKEVPLLEKAFTNLNVDKYLIIAKGDPLCYLHMKTLKERHPDIPSYYIEKCGHYIPLDRPRELNEALTKIFQID